MNDLNRIALTKGAVGFGYFAFYILTWPLGLSWAAYDTGGMLLSTLLWIVAIGTSIGIAIAFYWGMQCRKEEINRLAKVESDRLEKEEARRALQQEKEDALRNLQQEFENLKRNADGGDPKYLYEFGRAVACGLMTNSDLGVFWEVPGADQEAGVQALIDASESGHEGAMLECSERFFYGWGVEKDLAKALALLDLAKESQDSDIQDRVSDLTSEFQANSENWEIDLIRIRERPEYSYYFDRCESEPEALLLSALIDAAILEPKGGVLVGSIELDLQCRIDRYRVDFLVNSNLVVEVDGKAYHSNDSSFESDRIRDQNLLLLGYKTVRFPASQIYRSSDEVAEIIITVAS